MITLNAEVRDVKVNPKMIRKQGLIPAVYYGSGKPSTAISINKKEFVKAFKEAGESALLSLKMGATSLDVLIHDVALDPVIGDPIHADLYVVAKDHKIEVDVPLEFVGIAPAEKLGGIVLKVMHELRIESLPGKLPQHLTVDLAALVDLQSQITVADITLGDGVRSLVPLHEVVAAITLPQEESEQPATAPDLSAIEVEKKGKKEEDAAEEGGDKK